MADRELDIVITATDRTDGTLKKVDSQLEGMDQKAKKASRGGGIIGTALGFATGTALVGAVTGGLSAIGSQLSDTIGLAKVQIEAEKQLNAVLESTGHAAGLSADQIKEMASSLQGVTNFGDESIISGQNLLLTFTKIGADTFPRATEAMLDMSTAFGQDLKSSAIQLGKALNDPVAGVSALSRVGVSFTEQQKEMIATMVEAGDIAGAQAVILGELETQVGGSSRAMADPMVQLSNAFGDFKELIGMAVVPLLNNLAQRLMPLVSRAIEALPPILDGLAAQWRDNVLPAIKEVWGFIDQYLMPILVPLGRLVGTVIAGAFQTLGWWISNVTLPALRAIWRFVDGFVIATFGSWQNVIDGIAGAIEAVVGWIDGLRTALSSVSVPEWLSRLIPGQNGPEQPIQQQSRAAAIGNMSLVVNAAGADPYSTQAATTKGVLDAVRRAGI